MVENKNARKIEALVTPEIKQAFANYCRGNQVAMGATAGEAIQLFLDFAKADYSALQSRLDSPLFLMANQNREQLDLITKMLFELAQTQNAMIRFLQGSTGTLPESGVAEDD